MSSIEFKRSIIERYTSIGIMVGYIFIFPIEFLLFGEIQYLSFLMVLPLIMALSVIPGFMLIWSHNYPFIRVSEIEIIHFMALLRKPTMIRWDEINNISFSKDKKTIILHQRNPPKRPTALTIPSTHNVRNSITWELMGSGSSPQGCWTLMLYVNDLVHHSSFTAVP